MANTKKIQAPHSATGKTVYAIVKRESDGYILNDADGAFAAAPADPYLALAEHGTIKGLYEASEARTVWTNGKYTVMAYEQAGGSPAPTTDTKAASGEMKVESDIEVEEITLPEIEASTVLAKEGTVQSILTESQSHPTLAEMEVSLADNADITNMTTSLNNLTEEAYRKVYFDPRNNKLAVVFYSATGSILKEVDLNAPPYRNATAPVKIL